MSTRTRMRSGHIFTLHHGDLHDGAGLVSLLAKIRPDEVYNLPPRVTSG